MSSLRSRPILTWSLLIAALVLVASIAGLVDSRVYADETENWTLQAQGQDIGNLIAVVVLLVAAARHTAGSFRAGLVWLGTALYFVYAFIVYGVAVHLNYLFLVYVAALGLSIWALYLEVDNIRARQTPLAGGRRRAVAAWVLVGTGVLFAALWLSELMPALASGSIPAGLTEAGLVVNPIHVIDLSAVLPAFIMTGLAARRGGVRGLFWLVPWLVFSVLMGTSIVAAMALILATGGGAEAVPPLIMVSLVVVASLVAAGRVLRPEPAGHESAGVPAA